MKTINTWLLEALAKPHGTFSHCMLITRRDGEQLGFTDHSKLLVIDDLEYTPQHGTDQSEMQSNARAGVDNMEIAGVLDDDGLAKADILSGLYDDARLDVFLVDYTNLPALAQPGDCVWLKTFLLGNSRIEDNQFKIECRSLSDYLNKQIVEVTSPNCRAQFGDTRCKKSLAALTHTVTVAGVTDQRNLTLSSSFENDYFQFGKIEWLSGTLTGYVADIANSAGASISLYSKAPLPIGIGNSVKVTAGCNKTFDACISFANALNFQGEPHVPGIDKWKAGYQEVK